MAQEFWWLETARAALEEAVSVAGGQVGLAREIALRLPHVSKPQLNQKTIWVWLQRGYVNADHGICLAIEAVTGVPKERLRPDVYDPDGNPATSKNSGAVNDERAAS